MHAKSAILVTTTYLNAFGSLALCGGDVLTLHTVSCKLTPVFHLLSL